MDSLTPLLRAFYTEPLTSEARANIHRTLLCNLTDSTCQSAAIQYITDIVCNPRPIDPFLLHHCLLIVETLVRTTFPTIPQSDRSALYNLLLKFLTHAHITHLLDRPSSERIPPHAVNKAAAALVALSKRLWLSGLSDFPSSLLRLIDSPAHTTESLASLLAGHALLTTLLDDLVSARHDLLASDAARLRRLVSAHATHFLSALEVALRAAGPRFPSHVSPTAARAVATLVKLEPSIASHATAVLSRSVLNRFDNVAAHILTSIADILSTPAVVDCTPAIEAAVAALDTIATTPKNVELSVQVPPALFAVLDPLVSRLVHNSASTMGLGAVLNGLMGVTTCWATRTPHWLPRALDMWVSVLDSFDDAERGDDPLLQRVYDSVLKLCAELAFFGTNSDVLRKLEGRPHDLQQVSSPPSLLDWDAVAEKMADIASNPSGPSSPALFFENAGDVDVVHEGDDLDEDGDVDGWEGCSANAYTAKCVEVIAIIARMERDRSAYVATLIGRTLSQGSTLANVNCVSTASRDQRERMSDMFTAFSLAYALAGMINIRTVEAHFVCETVTGMLSAGIWRTGRAGVMGLRAAAAFLPYIVQDGKNNWTKQSGELSQWTVSVLVALKQVGADVLAWNDGSERIHTAGALLCVTLYDSCRGTMFANEPPIPVDVVANCKSIGVSCLGAGSLVRWATVPGRDFRGTRGRWSDSEWETREMKLGQMCEVVFGQLGVAASIGEDVASVQGVEIVGRLIGLLRTLVLSVHGMHGRTADVVWRCVGRNGAVQIVRIVHSLGSVLLKNAGKTDDDGQKSCANLLAACLNCVGSIALTFSLQLVGEGKEFVREVISSCINVARSGASVALTVAHAVMRLIRDRIACGETEYVLPGVEVATSALRTTCDAEVMEVGISLITEAVKRHWLMFWPEDKVVASPEDKSSGNCGDTRTDVLRVTKKEEGAVIDEQVRRCYFDSLGCIVEVLRSEQLGICRSGLLALQQLNASRRLYVREAGFRSVGAGKVVTVECVHMMGGGGDASRESLSDEAVEVLWGIASSDIKAFVMDLPDVVRQVAKKGGLTLNENMVGHVVKLFDGADNRAAFGRAASAMANDMMYYSNLIPSL